LEAKYLSKETEKVVAGFMYEETFVHFGVTQEIVTNQGTKFTSNTQQYHIRHSKSSPYHMQANGKVESTNKVLKSIFIKTVRIHHKFWASRLLGALWAYQKTWRNVTRFTPCELVYGKQVVLLIEFQINTLRIAVQVGMDIWEAEKN
jgi:hypothetical protein